MISSISNLIHSDTKDCQTESLEGYYTAEKDKIATDKIFSLEDENKTLNEKI